MTGILILMIVGLVTSACSSGSSTNTGQGEQATNCRGSDANGRWTSVTAGWNDTFEFFENCTGTSTYCASNFNYPAVIATTIDIEITSTNNNTGCPKLGTVRCQSAIYDTEEHEDTLTINCGFGNKTYRRQ